MRQLACLLATFVGLGAVHATDTVHAVQGGSMVQEPTTRISMEAKLEDAAVRYSQFGNVARSAFFDIAHPATGAELAEMGGYSVALVTALSHDDTELPPARVYVELDGQQIPLTLIAAPPTRSLMSERVRTTLGPYRWQGLFLFPVAALQDGASLKMDFAANRNGFSLGSFSGAQQDELGYGGRLTTWPAMRMPPEAVLVGLIRREFPGSL
jgi:hypothetical protein